MANYDFVERRIKKLREQASERERAGEPTAALYTKLADDLESDREAYLSEGITIAEAAAESGYTAVSLWRFVKEGIIPTVGKRGNATLIRRGDLPRKPGHGVRPLMRKAIETDGPLSRRLARRRDRRDRESWLHTKIPAQERKLRTKRVGSVEMEKGPCDEWRYVNWERRAKRDIMAERGITSGRQWKRLKREMRRNGGTG